MALLLEQAFHLLDRYPPSDAKLEAARLLRRAQNQISAGQPLRFPLYDILYAFQQLEARRWGIRRDRYPAEHEKFRRAFISAVAMWVPGKDRYIDGLREVAEVAAKHNDEELNSLLQTLVEAEANRTSNEQSRRASSPRKPKSIDRYIEEILTKNPKTTLEELWGQVRADEYGDVIETIEHDQIFVRGVIEPYTRGSIRNRFYKIRNSLRQSH